MPTYNVPDLSCAHCLKAIAEAVQARVRVHYRKIQ